jgi:hypothetical protein
MMDVEFPTVYCIICENFGERDGKTFTEKSLTSLTVHVQTYKHKKAPSINIQHKLLSIEHNVDRCALSFMIMQDTNQISRCNLYYKRPMAPEMQNY